MRKNIAGGEPGVPLTMVVQVVDYQTCKTVPDVFVDVWSSNATVGVSYFSTICTMLSGIGPLRRRSGLPWYG